jgi:hypothetical protein
VRIPSGVVDQYIYFVAVDETDYITRVTGLSGFTVYRSRNGAAAASYTTPTVNETDVTNMPGVYELLLDEDMTIDAGDQSQEVALHITKTGMAPVTRVFELYRPSVTAGETIGVSAGAVSNVTTTATATAVTTVNGLAANVITSSSIATDAIDADALASDVGTEIATAVWASGTRSLTVLDEDSTTLDLDATIRAAVGLATANLDTQLDALPTAAENTTAVWAAGTRSLTILDEDSTTIDLNATILAAVGLATSNLDTQLADIETKVDDLETRLGTPSDLGSGATVAANLVDIESQTDDIGVAGAGLTNINLPNQTMDIVGDITGNLSGSVGSVTGLTAANLDVAVSTRASQASVDDLPTNAELNTALGTADDAVLAAIGTVDTVVDAIQLQTDQLAFTVAGQVDANIESVNTVTVNGTGTLGDEWGP